MGATFNAKTRCKLGNVVVAMSNPQPVDSIWQSGQCRDSGVDMLAELAIADGSDDKRGLGNAKLRPQRRSRCIEPAVMDVADDQWLDPIGAPEQAGYAVTHCHNRRSGGDTTSLDIPAERHDDSAVKHRQAVRRLNPAVEIVRVIYDRCPCSASTHCDGGEPGEFM